MPGLGHLYAGRPLRGLALLAAVEAFAVAGILLTLSAPGAVLRVALMVLLVVVGSAAAPVDAARVAGRAEAGRKHAYQRWYVLAIAWLAGTIVIPDLFVGFVKRNVAEAFKIPGGGMTPTLLIGDYVLVRRRLPATLDRGTIVTYRFGAPNTHYVQRIVGVAGDTLQMRDFRLYRNGAPVAEPYAHADSGAAGQRESNDFDWQRAHMPVSGAGARVPLSYGSWGPLVVPADSFFLLGDARSHSLDSRFRGFIPRSSMVATPAWIYFSRDPATGEIRWDRIGRRVE